MLVLVLAFCMLIDRKNLSDKYAFELIASSFIPQGMKDGNGGIFNRGLEDGYFDPYAINTDREGTIQKAITLLKKAGYEFNEDGMLSSATPLTIDYYTNGGGNVDVAEAIQKDLSVVGIDVSIRVENDWNIFMEEREKGNFDIAREGYLADFDDPICMLALYTTDSLDNDPQFGR